MKIDEIGESVNNSWRAIGVDSLPREAAIDICHAIAENNRYFIRRNGDWQDVKGNLLGLVDEPKVLVGWMDVQKLYRSMDRQPSSSAVRRYVGMLEDDDFDFDPILVSRGNFLDGGHRLEAYFQAGRKTIPVVEVSHLVEAPDELWRAWVDGEDVSFELPRV